MIWKNTISVEDINKFMQGTLVAHLGMRATAAGEDWIEATMPVDERTVQPFGILHGGASVALAESLGSIASTACIEDTQVQTAVGVEINANHLRPVRHGGAVRGRVSPLRVGRRLHVWHIEIRDVANDELVCVSRLTIAIIPRPKT